MQIAFYPLHSSTCSNEVLSPKLQNKYTTLDSTVGWFLSWFKYVNIELSDLHLNYVINPSSRQAKVHRITKSADTVASKEKCPLSSMRAGLGGDNSRRTFDFEMYKWEALFVYFLFY